MTQEKKKNPHQGHRDRMRERIKSQGVANMPQHEILEVAPSTLANTMPLTLLYALRSGPPLLPWLIFPSSTMDW